MSEKQVITLTKANSKEVKSKVHTPSVMQADTLFTFTPKLEFLIPCIETKMISPRYCVEDIRYLKIPKMKKIAFPMKCFCDINLHRLDVHLDWYGYYGLAFSKEWGMEKGIQPIQYINPNAELRKDFTKAFMAALTAAVAKRGSAQLKMQNFLLHELMYYKPYDGKMENRNTQKVEIKCFTDECEWRFVPDVTKAGYEQVLYDETIVNAGVLGEISNSMAGIPEISLEFKYEDLKYIIVRSKSDFQKLVQVIETLEIDEMGRYDLISKIIIWDNSGGDF